MSLCHVSITVCTSIARHVLLLYTANLFSWSYAHDYISQALHAVHNVRQQHVVALQASATVAAAHQCAVCYCHCYANTVCTTGRGMGRNEQFYKCRRSPRTFCSTF
eukprot:12596-Heterococcus_DN1.PRE.3